MLEGTRKTLSRTRRQSKLSIVGCLAAAATLNHKWYPHRKAAVGINNPPSLFSLTPTSCQSSPLWPNNWKLEGKEPRQCKVCKLDCSVVVSRSEGQMEISIPSTCLMWISCLICPICINFHSGITITRVSSGEPLPSHSTTMLFESLIASLTSG